ncbi:histidinol-phosphate transaminase [Buchnera aphidicola (Kurisakia onigurumii)]|uniref:histidinol-phosphate transaminase n=1 Tax=Buchnera aphidicola TaxID=9 RepID=UPI0031B7152C
MSNIKNIIRKNIKNLIPYQSARKINNSGKIFLNANEIPINKSIDIYHKNLNRYPNPQPNDIIKKYSEYSNINTSSILVTRGADEGIELLIKIFCNPYVDQIMTFPPTYPMYGINADILGIKNVIIPFLKNWKLDIKKIMLNAKNTKIIYLCRPNNPTGHLINKKDIIYLLKKFIHTGIIVIDEAYIEFCIEESLAYLIDSYPNLVILRTLSKAFGLAGIRCGFILANIDIITFLQKSITPYPIPTPVIDIVNFFLTIPQIQKMNFLVQELNQRCIWLSNELKKNTLVKYVFPTKGNYLLVEFFFIKKVFNFLSKKGIIIRAQTDKIRLENCIRISIGSKNDCLKLLQELHVIRSLIL